MPTTESRPHPAGPARPLLSTEINTATRSLHTKLNRLITARLPLALPPHSASPRLYASGLLHFAHVYLTFESAWQDMSAAHHNNTNNPHHNPALSSLLEDPWISVCTPPSPSSSSTTATPPSPSSTTSTPDTAPSPALLTALAALLPPGLPRSRRLRRDLSALLNLRPVELDVRLATAANHKGSGVVAAYAAHIRGVCHARPHVLVAYAWVMYMAVFAGGRWIRGQLVEGGRGFWENSSSGVDFDGLGERGLAFFGFEGDCDGEDVKGVFKERLGEVEGLLSEAQRAEVVEEARAVFEWSIALVEELDGLLDTPEDVVAGGGGARAHAHAHAAAPVSEEKGEVEAEAEAEKAGLSPAAAAAARSSSSSLAPRNDWVRQGGSVAGALVVLGGVYWWAACFLGTALREGWHEGWAGI
ncbi:heme oxygenase [Diplodia corticola]|uniref:Heme oxygenase n=1 Tax=Diplodia corticola TaxID=236234 RepID=A0A1J9RSG2_9PEZI|nr:heme oxygenase [Diplodia corticola]OJD30461.1 heme oxygenase [Diplodia corticola]